MPAPEAFQAINAGQFDKEISSGKTELTEEEKRELKIEQKRLQEELEKRRVEFEAKAKEILKLFEAEPKKAKKAMIDAGIPYQIIKELVPMEAKERLQPAERSKFYFSNIFNNSCYNIIFLIISTFCYLERNLSNSSISAF